MRKKIVIFVIIILAVFLALFINKTMSNNSRDHRGRNTQNQENIYITLYFPSTERQFLIGEQRQIASKNNFAQEIVEQLAVGPRSLKSEGIFSKGSPLNRAFVENNIVYLDFDKSFLNTIKKSKWESSNILIYSIVNSVLDNIPVKRVQLLVEGKKLLIEPDDYSYFNPLTKNNIIISHMEDLDLSID